MGTIAATAEDLTAELVALEQQLLQPAVRRSTDALQTLLLPEFVEFGSSGRVFDRTAIVQLLLGEETAADPRVMADVHCAPLGDEAALLTYRLCSRGGVSLRSSLWVRRSGQWRMLFHQGTQVQAAAQAAVQATVQATVQAASSDEYSSPVS